MSNNKRAFLDTLREMKGKPFVYAEKQFILKDYSTNDVHQRVSIFTDKRTFEKSYENADEFLSLCTPVMVEEAEEIHEPDTVKNAVVIANHHEVQQSGIYEETATLSRDLISLLKENIENVRKDKSYIPQAQAINNNINSIINVSKLQLDVYKQFKGRKAS